jgi:hypothetical protein
VKLCPACYRAIERAPLLHVRRILLACETCRPIAQRLAEPQFKNAVRLSIVSEEAANLQRAAERGDPQAGSPLADSLLDYVTRGKFRKKARGRR